jgi:hypothetical protein
MRVRGSPTTLQLVLNWDGKRGLNATGDDGTQLHIESSTNLMDWVTDPVIYCWQHGLPVDLVEGGNSNSPARFFRFAELPLQ